MSATKVGSAAGAILIALLFIFNPVEAETPKQFDLICESQGNTGPLIPPTRMRFDLNSGHWCMNGCQISHGGASIVDGMIILEIKKRDLPDGMKLSEVQVVYLDTLAYWGASQITQGDNVLKDPSIRGACHLAPYTDVTGPLQGW